MKRAGRTVGDLAFVLPAIVLTTAVMAGPAAYVAYRSVFNWNPGGESPFVGLENFSELLTSDEFRQVLWNQVVMLLTVPVGTIVPLLLAFLLYDRVPGASFLRTVIFFPSILSAAVLGFMFGAILAPEGPLNETARAAGLGSLTRSWLSDPATVKPTLIVLLVWASCGTGLVIFSAALTAVPTERFEAAEVDGAKWWQLLWHVMLPSISSTVRLWIGYQILGVFLWTFTWVYVLTNGGPGFSSTTIDFDIYQNTFQYHFFGYAAAECVVLIGIVSIIIAAIGLSRRIGRRR